MYSGGTNGAKAMVMSKLFRSVRAVTVEGGGSISPVVGGREKREVKKRVKKKKKKKKGQRGLPDELAK